MGCELHVVDEEFTPFVGASGSSPKLGLHGTFQKKNAAIAVAMCRDLDMHVAASAAPAALSEESLREQASQRACDLKSGRLPEAYLSGLERCKFAGRAQVAQVPVAALPCLPEDGSGMSRSRCLFLSLRNQHVVEGLWCFVVALQTQSNRLCRTLTPTLLGMGVMLRWFWLSLLLEWLLLHSCCSSSMCIASPQVTLCWCLFHNRTGKTGQISPQPQPGGRPRCE